MPSLLADADPAHVLRDLAESGQLEMPLPGAGGTIHRWARLSELSFHDTVVGRLAEAHADADAILADIGDRRVRRGDLWGVWAAEPADPVLRADHGPDGWSVTGRKLWCSGAHLCTHALVTATARDGRRRLFAVDLARADPVPGSWHAVGMRDSDSGAVDFAGVPAAPVGEPGEYLARPGFWYGAIGVAACWYGAACALAATLHARAAHDRLDEHGLAHLGAITAELHAARVCLQQAARAIDDDPADRADIARRRATTVRAVVEHAAAVTLDRVGRALGAGPLCDDADHARRVADLTVYLRQSHAERDLADLGRDVGKATFSWLPTD